MSLDTREVEPTYTNGVINELIKGNKDNAMRYLLDGIKAGEFHPPQELQHLLKKKEETQNDFITIGADEIFTEQAPIPWIVNGLRIAPGAPTILAGYGFSGKSILAQEIAISVASGTKVFGVHEVKRGKVLHLDYEQGKRVTTERYKRLAQYKGLNKDALANLEISILPKIHLDNFDGYGALVRALDGRSLVLIDSLRASMPSVDENASDIRKHLDQLTHASECTGATIILIHHARKPSNDKKENTSKFSMRGSSGIFDAASTVFSISAEKGKPSKVVHEKCRHQGIMLDDFCFSVKDVDPTNRSLGLIVSLEPNDEKVNKTNISETSTNKNNQRTKSKLNTGLPSSF